MSDAAPGRDGAPRASRPSLVRWSSVALALAVATAALAYDPRAEAAEPKRTLALIVATVALAAAMFGDTKARTARAPHPAWLAILGFVLVTASSFAYGRPGGALDLETFVAALGLGVAAARLGRARAIRAARLAARIVGTAAAAACVTRFALGGRGFDLHGGQGNPNWLGLLLAVCMPISLEACAAPRRRGGGSWTAILASKPAAIAMLLLQALALLLAHSRVGWCAAGASTLLLVVAPVGSREPARPESVASRRRVFALAAGALLAFAMVSLDRALPGLSADVSASASLSGRLWIARQSLRAAWAAAPLGAGLGGFAAAFLEAQGSALQAFPAGEAARRFINATTAHDDVLQAAVESGAAAAALLVAFVALAIRGHLRGRWPAGAASTLALAIAMLGDSPLRQPAIVCLVALITAGLPTRRARALRAANANANASSTSIDGPEAWRAALASPRARVVVLVALFAATSWTLVASARAWLSTRARLDASELVGEARVQGLARAVRIDGASGAALLELGLAELAAHDAAAAREHLIRSRSLLANAGTDSAIGEASLELGDPRAAVRAFTSALALNPGSARAHLGRAEADRATGDLDRAEDDAGAAMRLLPGDPRPRALLDRIREERMDR